MVGRNSVLIVVCAFALLAACTKDVPDEDISAICEDGLSREGAACGLNGRGYLPEKCVKNQWVSNGNCVDSDWCKDGDTWLTLEECGLNGKGSLPQRCVEGQWIDSGQCKDPDVCVNGTTQEVVCGYNGNGEQAQKCLEGQWVDDGTCIDPDECENGTWQTKEGTVSECVSGKWVLRRATKQWGGVSGEWGFGVAVDGPGNVFVAGSTAGIFDGNVSNGKDDVFLTKWNADGSKAWTRQWGTDMWERAYALVLDAEGNIFVTGATYGSLDGNTNTYTACIDSGDTCTTDIFLTKWYPDGTKAWTKQWGSLGNDEGFSVAVDAAGNIFVTGKINYFIDGNTNDNVDCDACTEGIQPCAPIFLTKWNADGTYAWTKQWGAHAEDKGWALAVDREGDVFVTGVTFGSLEGTVCNKDAAENCSGDIFLTKLHIDGTKEWTRLWGANKIDYGTAVAVDGDGNAFVVGYATGSIDENTTTGTEDLFLSKWDTDGVELWTQQWGSLEWDYANAVTVDTNGNILVAGSTLGSLDDFTSAGASDLFLTKWHTDGTKVWTKQWGSEGADSARSVAVDAAGNIYATGDTEGSLDGNTSAGEYDIFLTIIPAE